MNQDVWTDVDRFFAEHTMRPDPLLDAALAESAAAGLPDYQISPNQGQFLMLLALAQGAKSVLEIGALGGYSTICLARALPEGGRLVTLEVDPRHAAVARANITRAGQAGKVELIIGPALETLPRLASERRGPFDFIFIDADKNNNPAYFSWALKLSRPGSLIVVDNVVRNGDVVDTSSRDGSIQGVRRLFEMIRAEPRVLAAGVQTVGSKGYDGLVIVRVAAD